MKRQISRRRFGQVLSLAAGATAFSAAPQMSSAQAQPESSSAPQKFSEGFLWGSATASYQVEGAVHEDAAGDFDLDRFPHTG